MSDILNVELYENIISYDILFADNPLLKLGQVVHVADLPWSKDAPMKMGIDELFNNTPYRGTVELIVNTNVEEKIVDTTPYEIVGTRVSIYNSGSSYNKVIFDTIDIFDRQEITMLYTIDGWQQVTMPAAVGSTLNNYIDDGNFDSGIAPKWTFNAGEINLSLETLQPLTGLYSLLVFKELGNQQTKKVTYPFTIYEADKNKILNFKCIFKPDTDYLNAYRIKIIDNETNIIADELLEAQQLPVSDFSFLFTTNDNSDYTLVIECNTDNTDSFDYVFDNFYVGEVLAATTTDTESQPVGTMIPYAGAIDSLDETSGWLFSDYRAVSQTTYADLFSKIGYRFSKDSADVTTMIANGTFRIPDGRGRVPRGAYNAVIQSIDTGTEIITLVEQVFVRNGTPVKFYTNGGTLPTIGGSPVDENTVYFVGVISGSTIKLYNTEANAITGGATGLINFDGNVTGTVILSSCGVYEEDAFQGWQLGAVISGTTYYGTGGNVGNSPTPIAAENNAVPFLNFTQQGAAQMIKAVDDGTNGPPRTSNETRGSDFTANWIIRWKQQATASFFKQTATLKDAGKVYIDTQKPNANGLNARGDIILSGKHVYLISNYPDLFDAGIPISDLILPCDGSGDTNSPDGIHFTTLDMSMQFVRGAIYGHLLSTAWDVTTADDVDLGRSDIPNGTPIYFDVSPCTGVDAETVYYLGLRTGTRYVLYDTEANANINDNLTGKIALSGTAVDSNFYSVSLEQLDAMQRITGTQASIRSIAGVGYGIGAFAQGFGTGGANKSDSAGSPSTDGTIKFDSANSPNARTSNETRPTNVQVFYYITAKNTPIIIYAPPEVANDFTVNEDLLVKGNLTLAGDLSIKGVQGRTLVNVEKIVENANASTTGATLVNLGTPCVYTPLFADSIVIADVTYSFRAIQTGGDDDAQGYIFARCVDSNETTQLKWLGSDDTAVDGGIVNAGDNPSITDIFSITDECVRGDDGKIRVRAYGARGPDDTSGYVCELTLLWQSVLFTEYR